MKMTLEAVKGPTILTADGRYFDFVHPQPETITLNAIARGLANTCRFAGQCAEFYSVAEHSVWVSTLVAEEHALAALMHDAAEAFIGDMPKPLKVMLPDYQAVEQTVENAVLARFGISSLSPEVKRADVVMLRTEQLQLMGNRDRWEWTDGIDPADICLLKYQPDEAYAMFMDRAGELGLKFENRENFGAL